ncbi:Eco57I restriction-modification methylase domain-containing protein [Lentibacillus amyloliquefaciens]|uniref:site-specific DNA-methyltransferase (adenine-specific) n=1 Tax=Lentibacillus amyloliquefaciens TaxID=1472767 RepID=A0A0U3WBE1_9BACI|nr:N-6 DNA methylase [Lentibacillus amyloliquefaciens]ALX47135.1 hypothetical protein AOX59_00070 [Lentibacillus amyloliquefaciens]
MPAIQFNDQKEQEITKSFYQDYQTVQNALFLHLLEKNTQLSEPVLFDKSQKILNRILLLCFCEDYHLLSMKSFRKILQNEQHIFNTDGKQLWEKSKSLFRSFGESLADAAISKFFQEDTFLTQLTLKNNIFPAFKTITAYDFASDFDINVFGYVFEHTINDMGKRKKDGIFYTSSDITRLLLEETLLNWVNDRKNELYESFTGAEKVTEFNRKLLQHLESVKILDPAAGSGAFLNTAYDLLQNESHKICPSPERYDVSHNLFGVDLNDKSLGLAKLCLWLKTIENSGEWTLQSDNLKNGNAIIDDGTISGHAFDWHQEFPEVMNGGGFDIIIGNPPYVFSRNEGFTPAEKSYFTNQYKLTEYQINTYLLFIERSYHLLKEGGWFGFIIPNNLLTIDSCKKIRRFLLEHTGNLKIINIHSRLFEEADVDTCLLIFQKTTPTTVKLGEYINGDFKIVAEVDPEVLLDEQSVINISLMKDQHIRNIMNKIEAESHNLGTVATVNSGLVAYEVGRGNPKQTTDMKENRVYHSDFQVDDTYWRYLEGRDVSRYSIDWKGHWLKYGSNLAAKRNEKIFSVPRILVRQIPSKSKYAIHAVYTEKAILNDRNSNNIIDFKKDPLFLLGVINSKITTYWFIHKFDKFQRKTFPQFKVKDLKMFPVPDVSEAQMKRISNTVEQMLQVQQDKSKILQKMEETILNERGIVKMPASFKTFYEWRVDEWLKWISNLKPLSPTEKSNWLAYFESKKDTMHELVKKERQLNAQIDQLTAAVFNLTEEDQKLIDTNLKEFLA